MKRVTVSIVSHGHGELVSNVLSDLIAYTTNKNFYFQIVLTINIPENDKYLEPYRDSILIIRNDFPKGFGANHNQAFNRLRSDYFIVLNPDVALKISLDDFLYTIPNNVGVYAPSIRDDFGNLEDSYRDFPTIKNLLLRYLDKLLSHNQLNSSQIVNFIYPDWIAGMFMAFPSDVFSNVGGFDESYFMYVEDADICRRIGRLGYMICVNSEFNVIHDARRSTLKSFRHFAWHLRSMYKFLTNS